MRMRQEGREGKYMCRYIVHSMWEDVEQRSKIMGVRYVSDLEGKKIKFRGMKAGETVSAESIKVSTKTPTPLRVQQRLHNFCN